jgi:hypothetical protein
MVMRRLRETNRICPEERGSGESALAFLALKNVDSVEVVCKDEHRPGPSADDLPEDIPGHLLPRETPKDSHAESHLYNVSRRGADIPRRVAYHRIHVAARDTPSDPSTEGNACTQVLYHTQ